MAIIDINSSAVGTALQQVLLAEDIQPGSTPSYQTAKTIYAYHPLGAKIVEKPITLAQSKPRKISIGKAPEVAKAEFEKKWRAIGADAHIFNLMRLSRVYGIASVAVLDETPSDQPFDLKKVARRDVAFNVFDPLNTAGSMVINQQPNDPDFLKTSGWLSVGGKKYHPSRTCVMMNEDPLYIEYTSSGFGFTGRSIYQRILFPMKSFVATMRTDDLIALKAGVLIAKLKQPGSIVDNIMQKMFSLKRALIQEATTYNVLQVGQDDDITSMTFENIDGAVKTTRTNILENIAAGADDMPAILLNQETFAQGFGEGSEDAKMVGRYVDRIREKMQPAYAFFDGIVQYLAWTPEFYKTVQAQFPAEYGSVSYETAFYDWVNSFSTEWPPYLDEPPSEQVKVDDVKLKAVIALVQVLAPMLDPDNKALLIQWAADNFNGLKLLFNATLELDYEALRNFVPEQQLTEPDENKPFAANDAVGEYDRAVAELLKILGPRADRARPRRIAAVN